MKEARLPYTYSTWTRPKACLILITEDSLRYLSKENLKNGKTKEAGSNCIFSGSSVVIIYWEIVGAQVLRCFDLQDPCLLGGEKIQ